MRHAFKAGGSFETFRDDYLAHVAQEEAPVAELAEMARRERCALLCVEAKLETCPRALLADVLAARGFAVEHL